MRYQENLRAATGTNASCARFCANVCGLFTVGREQCFLDCLSCRGTQGRAASHGTITVTDASDRDDCGCDSD